MKKLSLFCKIEKSCPNFDFVFREIAKMSPKFRFRVSRNFAKCKEIFAKHEITKTKIFAATLACIEAGYRFFSLTRLRC